MIQLLLPTMSTCLHPSPHTVKVFKLMAVSQRTFLDSQVFQAWQKKVQSYLVIILYWCGQQSVDTILCQFNIQNMATDGENKSSAHYLKGTWQVVWDHVLMVWRYSVWLPISASDLIWDIPNVLNMHDPKHEKLYEPDSHSGQHLDQNYPG